MKKRIVCILVCMLFVTSAFGVMSYGKVVRTTKEISKINECNVKFREETYSHVFAKVTPLDEKNFITNILQPIVIITSPEDGAVVTDPHLTVLGHATDEAGMNYWEWEWHYQGGSYSNSSYFETAEYVEFRIDIYGLHPGWNLVIVRFKNIYGAMGEDSVNVTYNPPDDQPPTVTIDSPENGATVTNPHITVKGLVTDNVGIVSIGAKQKWSEGETETSSTIPPTTYFPFEWDFDLYDGWNEITIYSEDAVGNRGEDTVEVIYQPWEVEVTFNQIDWFGSQAPQIQNSEWGEFVISIEPDDHDMIFVNVVGNSQEGKQWLIPNLPIPPKTFNPSPTISITFDLGLLGVSRGEEIKTIEYSLNISYVPLTTPPPAAFVTAPVGDTVYDAEGRPGGPNKDPGSPPDYSVLKFSVGPVSYVYHKGVPNIDLDEASDVNGCGPAAQANSLKWLDNKYDEIKIGDTLQKIFDDVDKAIGRGAGCTISDTEFLTGKLKYIKNKNLPIEVKFQDDELGDKDFKTADGTAKGKGKTPTFEFIKKELEDGEDVELGFTRDPPARGGHWVTVTGAIDIGGIQGIWFKDDGVQKRKGGTREGFSFLEKRKDGFLRAMFFGKNMVDIVVSESPKKPNNPPNKPSKPSGPTSGKAGTSYTYSTSTTDPDGDQVYYWFDWGDGTNSGWLGPYNSGQTVSASHTWSERGSYEIKVKAKDTNGAESEWSDPLPITMPKNKGLPFNANFWWFIKNFLKI